MSDEIRFGDFEPSDAFDIRDRTPKPRGTEDRYLTELADILRAAGLTVVEVDGWQTRARGSGGYDGNRPWCVMWHHTASQTTPDNDVAYIVHGCPDAPVANLYLARDGTVHVCAAGATNTNGTGGPYAVSRGTIPADSMNTHAVSIEAANNGVDEAWPQAQMDAYFATTLALTRWLGLNVTDVCTHYAWTPGRKIDPATADAVQGPWHPRALNASGTWNLADIHSELVRRYQTKPTPPTPPEDEEETMYLATLSDGSVVVVGSSVRPVSSDEIAVGGPYANLPRHTPAPESYWHQWLRAGCDEYARRVGMA